LAPSPSAFAGAFGGAYAPAWLVPRAGLGGTGTIVATVALLGMAVALTMLPGLRGQSLEPLSDGAPAGAAALGIAESRGIRTPPA